MNTDNQSVSILIVEDDELFSIELEKNLSALGYTVIDHIPRNVAAAWQLAEKLRPSLTLLDIHLENRGSGLDLATKLSAAELPYLFMTNDASDETFERACHLQPHSYLVKPFGPKRLHRNIQLALNRYKIDASLKEKIYSGKDRNGQSFHFPLSDITMVEAIGNYCYFHVGGQRYSARTSLSKLLQDLPATHFLQIHRRYLVAVAHVTNVNLAADLLAVGQQELHIGGKFKEAVRQRLRSAD